MTEPTPHSSPRSQSVVADAGGGLAVVQPVCAFVLAVVLLAACGSDANPLAGSAWRLVALGPAASPAAAIGDADLRFTTDAISGGTGCNGYGAAYRVQQSDLRLDNLRWTERGCPSDQLFQQEQRMQAVLATVQRFDLAGDRLTLHGDDGRVLIFERVPPHQT